MLKPFFDKSLLEAGCDEAGRGCLAGPVVAAAVILPDGFQCHQLNDSKKLNEKQRESLRIVIENKAVTYAVAAVDNFEIDEINILNASFLAMHRAIANLTSRPELLLIDGNRFKPYQNLRYECIIKGDGKFQSIAAASILAKTHRDDLMKKLHTEFPNYNWKKNKGYPTVQHRDGIRQFGSTKYHRQSFRLLPLGKQISLFERNEGSK